MILPDELRLKSESGCAFLVGNGINLYNESRLDWHGLLKKVFKKEDLPKGFLSLTFDAEVMNGTEKGDEKDENKDKNKKGYKNEYKKEIVNLLKQSEKKNHYKTFINYALENNCPILTTNYDQLMMTEGFDSDVIKKIKKRNDVYKPFMFSDVSSQKRKNYPFDCYYSDNELQKGDDIKKKFAIWHIHGNIYYQNSLCLGLNDYMRQIKELKEIFRNFHQNTSHNKVSTNNEFRVENTWLDILLHCNLVIFGLSLDVIESDLYWLLLRRCYYINDKKTQEMSNDEKSQENEENLSTIFVYNEKQNNSITEDKKAFLGSLGVTFVPYQSYEEIYKEYKLFTDD